VLADDAAELHSGKQIAPGGVQPDRDPAVDALERLGEASWRASVDPPVEVDDRGVPKRARFRSRHDRDGHDRPRFGPRIGDDGPTGETDSENEKKEARANGS
jgi:hypothetical protein